MSPLSDPGIQNTQLLLVFMPLIWRSANNSSKVALAVDQLGILERNLTASMLKGCELTFNTFRTFFLYLAIDFTRGLQYTVVEKFEGV